MPHRTIIGDESQTLTADGQTTPVVFDGGFGTFTASGAWGGGTATLQRSIDGNAPWHDITSLSADGQVNFEVGRGRLRVSLSGATTPDLDFNIVAYQP